ncbi:hypothetical protein ACTFIR_012910 [Dictyostelium discoideum]
MRQVKYRKRSYKEFNIKKFLQELNENNSEDTIVVLFSEASIKSDEFQKLFCRNLEMEPLDYINSADEKSLHDEGISTPITSTKKRCISTKATSPPKSQSTHIINTEMNEDEEIEEINTFEDTGNENEEAGNGNEETGNENEEAGNGNEESGNGNEESGNGNEESGNGNEETGNGNEEAGNENEETGNENEEASNGNEESGNGNEETGTENEEKGNEHEDTTTKRSTTRKQYYIDRVQNNGSSNTTLRTLLKKWIICSTKEGCLSNLKKTIDLLVKLGLKLNLDKSVLEPTQSITFLGFQIDSISMKLLKACWFKGKTNLIAVIPFRLYTRRTNKFHSQCFTLAKGGWDLSFLIPQDVKSEILHCLTVLNQWNGKEISLFPSYDYVLTTDASESGTGATLKKGNKTIKTWSFQLLETQNYG